MRIVFYSLIVFLLSGCVTIPDGQPVPFYASKETFVACEVADAATTWYAIAHGAVELNPIALPIILLLKVVVVKMRYDNDKEINQAGAGLVLNSIACIPVINNIKVIKELK